MQNLLFCVPKAALLHGKSVGFAAQKSRFRNAKAQLSFFKRIIFTKQGLFSAITTPLHLKNYFPDLVRLHFIQSI
ncbi:hypothetical protein BWX39_01355 [Prevotella intermedia ATCC 25611 = DSM 20706]|nr:hypothetical protein BWX39_01355 [Prevotella intermedia ATCC 25611 = DSM 20706]